jgi:hypothetical protein
MNIPDKFSTQLAGKTLSFGFVKRVADIPTY